MSISRAGESSDGEGFSAGEVCKTQELSGILIHGITSSSIDPEL
jgi:hypothetical protein